MKPDLKLFQPLEDEAEFHVWLDRLLPHALDAKFETVVTSVTIRPLMTNTSHSKTRITGCTPF